MAVVTCHCCCHPVNGNKYGFGEIAIYLSYIEPQSSQTNAQAHFNFPNLNSYTVLTEFEVEIKLDLCLNY